METDAAVGTGELYHKPSVTASREIGGDTSPCTGEVLWAARERNLLSGPKTKNYKLKTEKANLEKSQIFPGSLFLIGMPGS